MRDLKWGDEIVGQKQDANIAHYSYCYYLLLGLPHAYSSVDVFRTTIFCASVGSKSGRIRQAKRHPKLLG